jgi:ketosteroid isomerase-like protein
MSEHLRDPKEGARPTEAKAVVRRYLDALLAGDLDAIRDSFNEDAGWTIHGDVPFAGPWVGRDRIVDDFLVGIGGTLFQAGSQSFDFPTLIGEGETVALEWRVRAKTAGGDDYDNRYCGIFVVRDGRIQEVREYFDSAYAARVLYPD